MSTKAVLTCYSSPGKHGDRVTREEAEPSSSLGLGQSGPCEVSIGGVRNRALSWRPYESKTLVSADSGVARGDLRAALPFKERLPIDRTLVLCLISM